MEIILLEDIETLGKAGSVVKVRPGYARNYLLPNGKAIPSTEANRKQLKTILNQRAARSEKKKAEALAVAAQLESLNLRLPLRVGKDGKAFGAIVTSEIVNLIRAQGVEISKHQLQLEAPLKKAGVYSIPVSLHPEVKSHIKLYIEEVAGD